ncbi:MAG TPA: hypothetical protein VN956_03780 [Pyrinomonadaceae bacterium]|nr:hypothetical protein [Pyrinomonadaceae bacterium]
MNQDPTKELPDKRSFEERVFARFDMVDARFDTVDARLEKLEAHSYDTKPIWERALKEIHDTRIELGEVKAGLAGVKTDVAGLKSDVTGLKTDVSGLKTDVFEMKNEFSDAKREVRRQVTKRLDQIQVFQFEYREDIRAAYERIEKLEKKVGLEPDHS